MVVWAAMCTAKMQHVVCYGSGCLMSSAVDHVAILQQVYKLLLSTASVTFMHSVALMRRAAHEGHKLIKAYGAVRSWHA